MSIKKIQSRSLTRIYLRALGISTLKNIALNTAALLGVLFVYGYVPGWLFGYGFPVLFLFITYLFAEWTFNDPRLVLRHAAIVTVAAYLWDAFVSILIWNRWSSGNLFFTQRLGPHLIFFTLHATAMLGAWYMHKRNGVKMSLAEGLEA